ncbi:RDD family protein [Ferrimonas lipolytica]|uniref:RDD family protein n=1 Tax=Ferrimonas lipolytica TaxID=2724191 RepID=A0A6H1UHV8_9GAMM|nr:RDD family protein [Ferrimonas lipolytica]QIZ78695.1 RDD family protein [Ferrimonas lipolytica]
MSLANAPRATMMRRLAAWAYDFLVGLAVYMLAGSLLFGLFTALVKGGLIPTDGMEHVSDIMISNPLYSGINELFKLLAVAYLFVWSWTRSGQTIGMRAWRIRAQCTDGNLMSKGQAWRRAAYAFGGFANFSLLWDSTLSALHDRLSSTEVVQLTLEQNRELLAQSKLR